MVAFQRFHSSFAFDLQSCLVPVVPLQQTIQRFDLTVQVLESDSIPFEDVQSKLLERLRPGGRRLQLAGELGVQHP